MGNNLNWQLLTILLCVNDERTFYVRTKFLNRSCTVALNHVLQCWYVSFNRSGFTLGTLSWTTRLHTWSACLLRLCCWTRSGTSSLCYVLTVISWSSDSSERTSIQVCVSFSWCLRYTVFKGPSSIWYFHSHRFRIISLKIKPVYDILTHLWICVI